MIARYVGFSFDHIEANCSNKGQTMQRGYGYSFHRLVPHVSKAAIVLPSPGQLTVSPSPGPAYVPMDLWERSSEVALVLFFYNNDL